MRRIDALVEKEVIKIAKENVNARPQFRKGKRRGKYYKDAVNKEVNRLKYKEAKEIREKVEHEYLERIDSGDFTAKSKHLMQRGESQELFFKGTESVNVYLPLTGKKIVLKTITKEKMFETYESHIDKVFNSYV